MTVAVEPAVEGSQHAGSESRTYAVALDQVVRYYGERAALRKVTLRLEQGHTLAVFGPNGAGKTTLLRMLATLLVPHEGEVRVLGHLLPRDAHHVGAVEREQPALDRRTGGPAPPPPPQALRPGPPEAAPPARYTAPRA